MFNILSAYFKGENTILDVFNRNEIVDQKLQTELIEELIDLWSRRMIKLSPNTEKSSS